MKTQITIIGKNTSICFEAENEFEQKFINDFNFSHYDISHNKVSEQDNYYPYRDKQDKKWVIGFTPKQTDTLKSN